LSLLGPNILLSTLFSNTLSLCSSLSVRDQVYILLKIHRSFTCREKTIFCDTGVRQPLIRHNILT
jgi:hypothetical protein